MGCPTTQSVGSCLSEPLLVVADLWHKKMEIGGCVKMDVSLFSSNVKIQLLANTHISFEALCTCEDGLFIQ